MLILDTGPIRELICYRAVEDLRFYTLRSELKYVTSKLSYEACGKYLSSSQRKITSPHVISELHTWIRNTPPKGQSQLWQLARDTFTDMAMDEHFVKFIEMSRELLTLYGPADTSLIELARRHLGQQPVIFTLDTKLHGECWNARISAELLDQVCNQ